MQNSEVTAGAEEIIAYWLCPAEPARSQFAAIIADLAARFDAPPFEPHMTVHVADANSENPQAVMQKVLNESKPFRLAASGLDYSDKFTKTLFVQFLPDARLTRFSGDLRRASASPRDYALNPHVSLLYKEMHEEAQRELAAAMTLPFTEVTFDSVKAIISPAEITSRTEIEAWRVVAEQELTT